MSMDAPESETLIPSGPWHGFYTYPGSHQRHRMDLRLDFKSARITGSGVDDIGRFAISGHYDVETLKCTWKKTYLGAHTVLYDGAYDLGSIYGMWTLPSTKGGFRIWPGARGEGEARYVEAAEDAPVEESLHVGPGGRGHIAPGDDQS
ncbi:MAG: hypothetical protein ACAI25_00160 [Planctomycetota bacterium]